MDFFSLLLQPTNMMKRPWSFHAPCLIGLILFITISMYGQRGFYNPAQDQNTDRKSILNPYLLPLDTSVAKELVKKTFKAFYADPFNLDSLRKIGLYGLYVCRKIDYDTGRLQISVLLSHAYLSKEMLDSAQFYLVIAIKEATNLNRQRRLCINYLWYGQTYSGEAKFDSAVYMYTLSKQIGAEIKDTFCLQVAMA